MRTSAVLAILLACSWSGAVVGQVTVDSLEPDPDCSTITGVLAYEVGTPNAVPCSPGNASKWTVARSIFPAGDLDHQWFRFNPTGLGHLVRIGTAAKYDTAQPSPTCAPIPPPTSNPDTFLELHYGTERDYFGRCGTLAGVPCQNVGGLCTDGTTCTALFNLSPKFGTDGLGGHDNPLACNDDRDTIGGDLGSEMTICLPDNLLLGTNGDDYCLRTKAASAPDTFNYGVQVRNLGLCPIEEEPNDTLPQANPINLGDTVNGIYDFAGHWPFRDDDLFEFDVSTSTTVTMETFGYDSAKVDTGIELLVGPDDAGNFFFLASDDNGGTGLLSKLVLTLPPADTLLGNVVMNANYIVDVTAFGLCPNFPYTLKVN